MVPCPGDSQCDLPDLGTGKVGGIAIQSRMVIYKQKADLILCFLLLNVQSYPVHSRVKPSERCSTQSQVSVRPGLEAHQNMRIYGLISVLSFGDYYSMSVEQESSGAS